MTLEERRKICEAYERVGCRRVAEGEETTPNEDGYAVTVFRIYKDRHGEEFDREELYTKNFDTEYDANEFIAHDILPIDWGNGWCEGETTQQTDGNWECEHVITYGFDYNPDFEDEMDGSVGECGTAEATESGIEESEEVETLRDWN